MQKKAFIKELKYFPPQDIVSTWPAEFPLLFLGGDSNFAILPIEFYETDFASLSNSILNVGEVDHRLPFISGYIGIVSYDEFCPHTKKQDKRHSRVFRVNQTLVFDQRRKRLFLCKRQGIAQTQIIERHVDASEFLKRFRQLQSSGEINPYRKSVMKLHLDAYKPCEDYLEKCKGAISDIGNGRYYQINLLRYFKIKGIHERSDLIPRFFEQAGPYGAIFSLDDLSIFSFSPERFVKLHPKNGKLSAMTYPIKGTIGRHEDQDKDLAALKWLKSSRKDHQELHMIVDLMRNDLNKISNKGTVEVEESAKIRSFRQVYHLEASIRSTLNEGLSFQDFFASIAPGGSITGAPKEEVMKAIKDTEGRNRGYFMGNCFYLDDSGFLDSSIMIRTLVSKPGSNDSFEYAAGSGIVLQSHPAQELREISTKCRVITR